MAGRDGPRTVVRPPGARRRRARTSSPGWPGRCWRSPPRRRGPRDPDPAALAAEARRRAEAFETAALRAGVPRDAVGEARDALLAVLEARARGNPALAAGRWAQARRRALPGVPEPDAALLARRRAAAEAAGPARRDLARFLRHCEEAVRGGAAAPRRGRGALGAARAAPLRRRARRLGRLGRVALFRRGCSPGMPAVEDGGRAGAGRAGGGGAASSTPWPRPPPTVEARARRSRRSASPRTSGRFGPGAAARAALRRRGRRAAAGAARRRRSPTALATEGGSLALYDTLADARDPRGRGALAAGLRRRLAGRAGGERPGARARSRRHAGGALRPAAGPAGAGRRSSSPRRGRSPPKAIRRPSPSSSSPAIRAMQALPGWSPAGGAGSRDGPGAPLGPAASTRRSPGSSPPPAGPRRAAAARATPRSARGGRGGAGDSAQRRGAGARRRRSSRSCSAARSTPGRTSSPTCG